MKGNLSFVLLVVTAGLAGCASSSKTKEEPMSMSIDRKRQVFDLLKSLETGDPGPAAVINPDKYIQHNLGVADGVAGLADLLKQIPPGSLKVNTVRVFMDGDHVFSHSEYEFFGPKVGFDIFRFEGGKIVEHWDNLQERPSAPNPSGRTMTDGPTAVADVGQTDRNKALVRQFLEAVLVNGRMNELASYFDGDKYLQHNPKIADGLSGLGAALKAMAEHGVTMKFDRVHKVLGEGNFVLAVSEGSFGGKRTSFYDLFRVEGGKISEHWDTIETIPPRDQWKNTNGKF